ncbi:WD40-repeat-containing domain protein [Radiomyces spectabilis]|uniref:WD40-repeat-containing domain protein n=1 Tax=Radiomyces spectabilis TaxID=64574 RepID=UPI00221F8BAD|nr:WD40-repeat-containing domain protein [Radiomyces spectabilis]KAI8365222.1 WD40-repeat-containing domain protein [Radiomyces spectabilis]
MQHNNDHDHSYQIPITSPFSGDIAMTEAPPMREPSPSLERLGYGPVSGSHTLGHRAPRQRLKPRRKHGSLGRYTLLQPYYNYNSIHNNINHCSNTLFPDIVNIPVVVEKRIDFLTVLPFELASLIMSFLDFRSFMTMSTVSRRWHMLFRGQAIWRHRMAEMNWKLYIPPEFGVTEDEIDYQFWYKQRFQLEQRWMVGQVTSHYLIGHQDSVYCVQFDDEKIISGSRDHTIKIWNLATYQCVYTLRGHRGSVLCLQYNNEWLVSGSSDTTVVLWDMKTLRKRRRLIGHTAGISDVCLSDRYVVSSSKDTSIRIWDIETGEPVRMLMGHRGPVNSIRIKDNLLVSVSRDTLIRMWNIETGLCIREFAGHTHGVACVQFDGKKIVSGSNDQAIKVWDAETGECLITCEGHTGLVRTLDFHDDKIVTASYDKTIRVWDAKTGACLLDFHSGHSNWIFDVRFDKKRIVR